MSSYTVVQVCQEYGAEGHLADLEDSNLFEEGGGAAAPGVTCLEATGDGTIYANASYVNATLAGDKVTCGIYGEGTVMFHSSPWTLRLQCDFTSSR